MRRSVLRGFALLGSRFDFPAGRFIQRFIAEQFEVVLVDVALFQVFKAEVGAEKPRRAILQRNAAVTLFRRNPHPLVGGAFWMIDYKKCHSLDIWRSHESKLRLTVAIDPEPVVGPALLADLLAGIDHFESAFVVLGLGLCAVLNLRHDLTCVLCAQRTSASEESDAVERLIHRPRPQGVSSER